MDKDNNRFIAPFFLTLLFSAAHAATPLKTAPLPILTEDKGFTLNFTGWAAIDTGIFDQGRVAMPSGAEIRNLRLGAAGTFTPTWYYELEVDFARNRVKDKNTFVRYSGLKDSFLILGYFKEPFSSETLNAKKGMVFMERSIAEMFSPSRHIGIDFNYHPFIHCNNFTFDAGVFTNAPNNQSVEHGLAGTTRVTWSFIPNNRFIFFLGGAASHRIPSSDTPTVFSTTPENDLAPEFINTEDIPNVSYFNEFNGETAFQYGSLTLQSDITDVKVYSNKMTPNTHFFGGYVQASYFLTGEIRPFVKSFAKFVPITELSHPYGAVELGLRYSLADLDSSIVRGGRERNYTAAIKWYVRPNFTFGFNYIKALANLSQAYPTLTGTLNNASIYALRMEYYFDQPIVS